jgi:hypothetical protein
LPFITLENLFTASLLHNRQPEHPQKGKIHHRYTEQKNARKLGLMLKLTGPKKLLRISQTNKRRYLKFFFKRKLLWKLRKKISQIHVHGRGKITDRKLNRKAEPEF